MVLTVHTGLDSTRVFVSYATSQWRNVQVVFNYYLRNERLE